MDNRGPHQWSLTYSGIQYWPLDPRPEDVNIVDIAHALSMLCRYNGQTKYFYSVAEHSVIVSHMVPPAHAFEALLHDASEAYCADMVRPIKYSLPDYLKVEAANMMAVRIAFGLPHTETPCVKDADNDILWSEALALLPNKTNNGAPWIPPGVHRPEVIVHCWSPTIAEEAFIARFVELDGLNRTSS